MSISGPQVQRKSFSIQKKGTTSPYHLDKINNSQSKDRSFQDKKVQTNTRPSNQQEMANQQKKPLTSSALMQLSLYQTNNNKLLQKSMSEQFKYSDVLGRKYQERYQKSLVDHQNNIKILQDIQEKALKLREKQKNERQTLKKLKKLYLKKLQQLNDSESFTKQMIQQKDRQIQFLTIQNQQLADKNAQIITAIEQNYALNTKNQTVQNQNKRLSQELQQMKQQYKSIKIKYDQQLQLLDEGIRSKTIQQEQPSPLMNISSKDLDELARALSQNKSEAQKLSQQLSINKQQLLKAQNTIKQKQLQIDSLSFSVAQLLEKNKQTSSNFDAISKYEQQLKTSKKENEQLLNLRKLAEQREKYIKLNNRKIMATFQQNILNLLDKKLIKQYSSVYDIFINLTKQFFSSLDSSNQVLSESTEASWVSLVDKNLTKLNDYFKTKAQNDLQRIQKVKQYMKNANKVMNKIGNDEETPQKMFLASSPQKFMLNLQLSSLKKDNIQGSQHSSRSQKKSIILEDDLNNAISEKDDIIEIEKQKYEQRESSQMDIKSQILQEEAYKQKNHPLMNSEVKPASKDNESEESFARSMTSSISQAQKNANYKANVRNAKLNAKLKKHK